MGSTQSTWGVKRPAVKEGGEWTSGQEVSSQVDEEDGNEVTVK